MENTFCLSQQPVPSAVLTNLTVEVMFRWSLRFIICVHCLLSCQQGLPFLTLAGKKMSPWKMSSASNKTVKNLLQQAEKMYWRSAATAHPFTKNKCSCDFLLGNFSAVKNQSIKGWHSYCIHAANAFMDQFMSDGQHCCSRETQGTIQFGKLGTENENWTIFLLENVVQWC